MSQQVLITGADGFIGSHLTELLVREDCHVRALSQYNSFNNWGWLEDVDCLSKIEILSGDVRDPHYCKHITKDIDIIFHLAALIAIPYSYIAPDSYVDTNIKGTLNICQAALENGVKRVIHTSTSEVYGTAQYVPIDESHPLQPQSPYSASKIGADMMAMSFYNAFDLPITIARPFNTYGPRQSARAIIPTIISQIAIGQKQIKLGDLSPTRAQAIREYWGHPKKNRSRAYPLSRWKKTPLKNGVNRSCVIRYSRFLCYRYRRPSCISDCSLTSSGSQRRV